jgi:hypothetical protein
MFEGVNGNSCVRIMMKYVLVKSSVGSVCSCDQRCRCFVLLSFTRASMEFPKIRLAVADVASTRQLRHGKNQRRTSHTIHFVTQIYYQTHYATMITNAFSKSTGVAFKLPVLTSLRAMSGNANNTEPTTAGADNTYEGIKEAARKTGDAAKEWMTGSSTTGSTVYKEASKSSRLYQRNLTLNPKNAFVVHITLIESCPRDIY